MSANGKITRLKVEETEMERKKRYVQVGVGPRGRYFHQTLAKEYSDTSEITAFCDINRTRLELAQKYLVETYNYPKVALYGVDEFEKMIEEQKPDCVIVTSIDRTHDKYLIKAMEMGCDVISEKPLTTDNEKCQDILDAVKRTGKDLRVTFNLRYAPLSTKVRELILQDVIGDIKSVHFEWMLNTFHGADYFRRWHRDKRNSGGLLVHKSTHHFDLVNYWLASKPKQVFAYGDLMFYGRENAENRGISKFYSRSYGSENAKGDLFALDLKTSPGLKELYLDAEHEDGYYRDQSVFGDGISIEDTMSVLVRYENGAMMTYSLTAYSPREGYRIAFTGTKGRMEVEVSENTYINSDAKADMEGVTVGTSIKIYPMFEKPYDVEPPKTTGSHGGGDAKMFSDIFGTPGPDPFNRAASHIDGALSILIGIAANKSIATGQPINIKDLVTF